jgi:hypothetical protein
VERDFQPINREWEEEYPLTRRLQVMAGAQVVNVLGSLSALASVESAGFIDVFWCFAFAVFHGALLAFIIGTFDTLAVRRTGKGSATLTRLRRVAFVPFPSEKVPWKDSHAVGFVATHDAGLVAWVVFIYLLLLCVLPGLVFYWFVIRPERFHVILCDVHGGTDAIIFRGNDREQVAEMAKVIAEATGLWHKTEF